MTTKHKIYLVFGTISLLTTILFVGQFYDPEDGDRTLFIKHKPTVKQYFYSPVAYYRYHPTKLSLTEEIEERAFQEFIANRDLFKNGNTFFLLAIILIQVTLTLLICGLFSLLAKTAIKNWQLISQFLINLVVTTFGITYILHADNFITSILIGFVITTLNLLTFILLNNVKLRQVNKIYNPDNV